MTPVFNPASGSTGVLPSSEIEIRFNEELFDKEKNHITAEYVKENDDDGLGGIAPERAEPVSYTQL